MTHGDLIASATAQAEADARVRALFLSGSLGKRVGDHLSDVDLIAVVAPDDHKAFAAEARSFIDRVAELVHWHAPHPPLPLFGAVTSDWRRIDLTVTVPGMVMGDRNSLKPLVDRDGLYDALPATLPAGEPDPRKVEQFAREFLRVLGLTAVVAGRGEVAVAITGAGLLRQMIVSLLVEEQGLHPPPGALHLSRILPAEDLAIINALPLAEAEMESVIDTNFAYARVFLPRARALAERIGAAWPEAFEAATRSHLKRSLGLDWTD